LVLLYEFITMHGHLNVKFVKINISEFKEFALNWAGNVPTSHVRKLPCWYYSWQEFKKKI